MQYKQEKTPAKPRCIYLILIIKPVKDNETLDTIFIIVYCYFELIYSF
jgi:hypothetical protein